MPLITPPRKQEFKAPPLPKPEFKAPPAKDDFKMPPPPPSLKSDQRKRRWDKD